MELNEFLLQQKEAALLIKQQKLQRTEQDRLVRGIIRQSNGLVLGCMLYDENDPAFKKRYKSYMTFSAISFVLTLGMLIWAVIAGFSGRSVVAPLISAALLLILALMYTAFCRKIVDSYLLFYILNHFDETKRPSLKFEGLSAFKEKIAKVFFTPNEANRAVVLHKGEKLEIVFEQLMEKPSGGSETHENDFVWTRVGKQKMVDDLEKAEKYVAQSPLFQKVG